MDDKTEIVELNSGTRMPRLGLGTWQIPDDRAEEAVRDALDLGYRLIDTAAVYRNEKGVGKGIAESGIERKDIFLTTKLAVFDLYKPLKAFEDSLARLGTDDVDLYLIHWPFVFWKKAWTGLQEIFESGRARAIGVSNFGVKELEELKRMGGMVPAVNQVEESPYLFKNQLVDYCRAEGIAVEAYSPLTRGKKLDEPMLSKMAEGYGKTPAQILIRWGLQHGMVMIPKSENREHMEENFDVWDFEIGRGDMAKLDGLNEDYSSVFLWSRT